MSLQLAVPIDSLTVLDIVPVGLAVLGPEGRVRWANAAFASLAGRGREECLDQRFVDIVGLAEAEQGLRGEAWCRRRDGTAVLLEISGGPLALT